MGKPYSSQEVAYLVGPLLKEDPDVIEDIVIIAIVTEPDGSQRVRMRGPNHTPQILGNIVASAFLAGWQPSETEEWGGSDESG